MGWSTLHRALSVETAVAASILSGSGNQDLLASLLFVMLGEYFIEDCPRQREPLGRSRLKTSVVTLRHNAQVLPIMCESLSECAHVLIFPDSLEFAGFQHT